jgi:hypothetical protein
VGLEKIEAATPAGQGASIATFSAIAVMLIPLLRTIEGWLCRFGSTVAWDYGPTQLALRVDMYVRGIPLYRDFRTPPYVPMVYGPIVPWITAVITPLFGTGPLAALEAGRVVDIASALAVCGLIFKLARRCGAGNGAAALAALTFMLSPLVQQWGFDYRVDMSALASELGGLLAFASGFTWLAVGWFAIAFFIKQGRLAGIAAVVLYSWSNGQRPRALRLGAAWLAVVSTGIGILVWICPWYWLNSFEALRVRYYDPKAAIVWTLLLVAMDLGLSIFAIVALSTRHRYAPLVRCFLITAFAQDFVSSLRWGSNSYYFFTTLAAVTILAAGGIDLMLERLRTRSVTLACAWGLAGATLLLASYLLFPTEFRARTVTGVFEPTLACPIRYMARWDSRSLARTRTLSGPILTDTADLVLADPHADVQWIDLMVLNSMRALGTFDDSHLIAEIRERKIAAFALDADGLERSYRGRRFFWGGLRAAIEQNYTSIPSDGPPYLMVPKSGDASR